MALEVKPEVEGNFVRENRLGWFALSMAFTQQAPQMLMNRLFKHCLVVRAEHAYAANPIASVTHYYCYSPLFESLRSGEKTPQYAVDVTKDPIAVVRVRPETRLEKENKALSVRHAQLVELNRKLAALVQELAGAMTDEQSTEATILLKESGVE